jgi:endonuclease/exonuclease/phosphatase family metal-dependent hydrolase
LRPLDGIWVRGGLKVVASHVVKTAAAATASDHLPIFAELEFAGVST